MGNLVCGDQFVGEVGIEFCQIIGGQLLVEWGLAVLFFAYLQMIIFDLGGKVMAGKYALLGGQLIMQCHWVVVQGACQLVNLCVY